MPHRQGEFCSKKSFTLDYLKSTTFELATLLLAGLALLAGPINLVKIVFVASSSSTEETVVVAPEDQATNRSAGPTKKNDLVKALPKAKPTMAGKVGTDQVPASSAAASEETLPNDAPFQYQWANSRDVGLPASINSDGTKPIGFRLAIPEFWQSQLIEEENGYSLLFVGKDTITKEDPPIGMLLGVFLGAKTEFSSLDAMTATYRDTTIASQRLLYHFKDKQDGHDYEYFHIEYPDQKTGKLLQEFAFFIETEYLIYRFGFLTQTTQSERNELFVWSIFNSVKFYDDKLK